MSIKDIKIYLHGKAASYLLNAYVDLQIEEAIIKYLKTREIKSTDKEVKDRVEKIIESTSGKNKSQKLIVRAFTYKRANGFADYWYSKMIYKLIGEKFPQEKNYYLEMKGIVNNPIIQTVGILFFYPQLIRQYSKKFGFECNMERGAIKKEILVVQKMNVTQNKRIADQIIEGTVENWKVNKLLQWSELSKNKKIFIKSAANTQLSAGNWDRIYSTILL